MAVERLKKLIPRKLYLLLKTHRHWCDYRRRASLSPEEYPKEMEAWLKDVVGESLDLDNPSSFNQKIQWLKLYDSTSKKGRLADKYLVREFVSESIGAQYLVPLLGVWDSADKIPFDDLPDRFALKATHGSAWNIIVTDKATLNRRAACSTIDRWLKTDYSFWYTFELHYQYCEPRVIAERYLEGFETGELVDYKVHVFNAGEPIILVCRDRVGSEFPKKAYYDANWNKLDLLEEGSESFDTPRPKNLETMLECSAKLAEGFVLVRADWYEIDGQLFFGEMTFTPANGDKKFNPKEWNDEFGRRMDLTVLPAWQDMHGSVVVDDVAGQVDAQ